MDEWMRRIEAKLDETIERLAKLEKATLSKAVTMHDIASELGVNYQWVLDRPWVQPNFGEPDIDGRPKRWMRHTWDEWSKQLDRHQNDWESGAASQATATHRSA